MADLESNAASYQQILSTERIGHMDHKKLIYPAILLAGVTACSDNDSSAPVTPETPETPATTTEYSVTAIDGYLRDAEVWLEVNGNFILDNDEPTIASGEGGKAVLVTAVANPEQYPVVVQANEGITADEEDILDNPEAKVTHSYAMSAPAGETVITPLSTQVLIYMSQHAVSKEEAIIEVAKSLGLDPEHLMDDFIASGNAANEFAASSIVDSLSLPASADELKQITTPGTEEAEKYAKTTAAVNERIKATVDETIEAGGDFTDVPDIFPPVENPEQDTDGDGVPDHLDAFDWDAGRYLLSDKLAYTTWYKGAEVIGSADNLGTIKTNEDKHLAGTTAGKAMWFYTPVNTKFRLSGLSDYQFAVSEFKAQVFTNIYVKPFSSFANVRIAAVASPSDAFGDPLRSIGGPVMEDELPTYVLTINEGKTLNSVMKELRDKNTSDPVSKADFIALEDYIDNPSNIDDDPEVTNGNFILKLGDSNYTGTEPFTVYEYEMAKTYTVGNGPKIVIANAVDVTQDPSQTGDPTGETIKGDSYGKMVMMYPADLGGEKIAPYAVIAPLSDYQDFSFVTDSTNASVKVYVVAKDGVDETTLPAELKPVNSTLIDKLAGKTVYKFDIGFGLGRGSLKETLDEEVINKLELINYVDNPDDGDIGFASNFVLINGETSLDDTDSFVLREFTFTAPSAE